MQKKYPFADLSTTTRLMRDEIVEAVTRVIDSGRYVGGPECNTFEEKLARETGCRYCVGVSNGLDALRLIFLAYKELNLLKDGDEVIVPANTYVASVLAISETGLKPVLIEPDPKTLNMNWKGIEPMITDRTRAVLMVHLYGRISWDDSIATELRNRGILLIEDNAQAIGARTADGISSGALGDAAAFSLYPTKNVGALGDAGAVTTNDEELARMVRALANYGSDRRYHNIVKGYNCRLDPLQAAVLGVKLSHLEEIIGRRRAIAEIYDRQIDHPLIRKPLFGATDNVWHQYVVRTPRREEFTQYLSDNNVGWDIHYAVPPHLQPCYSAEFGGAQLPITEEIADTVVSLPIAEATSPEDAREIAEIINRWSI